MANGEIYIVFVLSIEVPRLIVKFHNSPTTFANSLEEYEFRSDHEWTSWSNEVFPDREHEFVNLGFQLKNILSKEYNRLTRSVLQK